MILNKLQRKQSSIRSFLNINIIKILKFSPTFLRNSAVCAADDVSLERIASGVFVYEYPVCVGASKYITFATFETPCIRDFNEDDRHINYKFNKIF